jgi:hypothetical protein
VPGDKLARYHRADGPLPDLADALLGVHARLKDGREWTAEAEADLLRRMLP